MVAEYMFNKANSGKRLTRREQRDLDIQIGFLEGIVRRAPEYVDALQILGEDYMRRGSVEEGLRVDERLAQLRPDDALVHYNLACSYSLTEQYELAVACLERALSLGFYNFKWLAKEPRLANLREHRLYKRIRAKVRSMRIKIS
jgi:tetratricopeptide (TPR) repeat protein